MASDKELNAQAEDFLNAMAPRPVPPASRKKHTEKIEEEKPVADDEDKFLSTYILDRSNSVCDKPSRQVLINNDLHLRLQRYVSKVSGGRGALSNFLNNILTEFIRTHEDVMSKTFARYNNEKF